MDHQSGSAKLYLLLSLVKSQGVQLVGCGAVLIFAATCFPACRLVDDGTETHPHRDDEFFKLCSGVKIHTANLS